jgi:hypothetical protein
MKKKIQLLILCIAYGTFYAQTQTIAIDYIKPNECITSDNNLFVKASLSMRRSKCLQKGSF